MRDSLCRSEQVRRLACRCVGVGLLLLGAGCRSPGSSEASSRPAWIGSPKLDDGLYMYRVGQASGARTPEAARDAAYRDALAQISKEIFSKIEVRDAVAELRSGFDIQGAEILPGCVYTERKASGYAGWVQVSLPLQQKNLLIRQVELTDDLGELWAEARADAHAGQYAGAQEKLVRLVEEYGAADALSFEVEEAKILLGDVYLAQNDSLMARQMFENVASLSASEKWKEVAAKRLVKLPANPRFWPMRDRFGGQKVALLCVLREGGDPARFNELTNVLQKDCGQARLEFVDITRELLPAEIKTFFDDGEYSAALRAAGGLGAGVVLAVLYDIDPARRGKTNREYNVDVPLLDSDIKFFVMSVTRGTLSYNGQFKEVAGTQSMSRLAERAAVLMINRYLIPQCPTIR